jgi:phosphoserine phosphatase
MSQRLALFDLDNTLLEGDSDHAWGEFLINRGLVDEGKASCCKRPILQGLSKRKFRYACLCLRSL